jgi:hypothetical protein
VLRLKTVFVVCIFSALCQTAIADAIYNVALDTTPLVGHPAGLFYVFAEFTDGNGIGDANNSAILSNFTFGGGSALGSPLLFGGASGALETAVTLSDGSSLGFFAEQFAPGLQLKFSLDLTLNDDSGGTPDRFAFFLLDSSQVPLPTLAPVGDYFFGADIYSTGPIFDAYGSDTSRSLSVGGPASIPVPTITSVSSVPEPSAIYLLGGGLAMMGVLKHRLSRSATKGKAKA